MICVLPSYLLMYGKNDKSANFVLVFRGWHVMSPVEKKMWARLDCHLSMLFTLCLSLQHISTSTQDCLVLEQLVLLSHLNVFHHQSHCTATGMCSESFPCVLCPISMSLVCCHRCVTESCRVAATQNPLASPLKELLPWSKFSYID